MSFRLFVYYCAVCGAWAALLGWAVGRLSAGLPNLVARAGIKGLCLGLLLACLLSVVDGLWNYSLRQFLRVLPRVAVAVVVGSAGGMLGGVIGQAVYAAGKGSPLAQVGQIGGWTLAGLLIGASLGLFDLLAGGVRQQNLRGPLRKVRNGVLGGLGGGLLGSALLLLLERALFADKSDPWSPGALGVVVLGVCLGFLIGSSQVLLKEAWMVVESGFRAGRQLILARPELTIGRAEACELGLFGDPTVERLHARIVRQEDGYVLTDAGSASGTFLNDRRLGGPALLHSGDRIRIGRNVLLFHERVKRGD